MDLQSGDDSQAMDAHFMDGQSARVRSIIVRLNMAARADDSVLILHDGDQVIARWPLSEVREKTDQANASGLVLTSHSEPDARLIITNETLISDIRRGAPNLRKVDLKRGTLGRIFKWAGGAIAAVLLIVFVIVPALADRLATFVPIESERKLGEATIRQISWILGRMDDQELRFCGTPKGTAALDKMVARLKPQFSTQYDINVRVLRHPMENAFAVPGGQVIVFDGLMASASSPEEIAGVLGHELGHVVHRDPTRLALRSAGTVGILGMLIGDFTGGSFALILTERLIAASYAQDAETAADEFAYHILGKSGLPSTPFGNFFERMAKIVGDDTGLLSHLASHPNLSSRAEKARAADVIGRDFRVVLSDEEWDALKNICKTPDDS